MDVFDLVAKIRLDTSEYEQGVGQAKGTFSKLASGVKTGLATVAKVGGAAVAAGAAGVAALTKMGISSYAQYEQLAGGAELLWGDAYEFIADKAKGAYATVQMSQNEYLQQVNGFSTGLKTALGGNAQAAAELATKIITAEADIVAATGVSQEAVQNAFNGIMKSNFTMLDNLQLGITPTKEGFQEVIDKVNKWNAANGEATKYQISNLADCQSALVDYIEMQGLSGYAANEAAGTIQGSLAMVKSAWENLVTGMADENADITGLIDNLVSSAGAAAENIIPRVQQTLVGVTKLVEGLAPVIINALPGMVTTVLPALISAALSVVMAFLDTVTDNMGLFLQTGIDAILQIANGIADALPQIISSAVSIITEFVGTLTNTENMNKLLDTAILLIEEIVTGLIDALPKLIDAAFLLIENLVDFIIEPGNLEKLLDMAITVVVTIMRGLIDAIPELLPAAMQIVLKLVAFLLTPANIARLVGAALAIVVAIAGGLVEAAGELVESALELVGQLSRTLTDTDWASVGEDIINKLWDGLKSAWDGVASWFNGVWDSLFNRSVSVGNSGGGRVWMNSHATGLNYVPYDEYQAVLHRGEAVLTAAEAKVWRNGSENGGIVQLISATVDEKTEAQNKQIISLLSGILDATANGNAEMVDAIRSDKVWKVGEREFGRLVKQYA